MIRDTEEVIFSSAVPALHEAFREALDDYLADCAEQGVTPEKPASGKVMLRIAPEVHAAALKAAARSGTSLNKWAEGALGKAARKAPAPAASRSKS